jgi:hypothetical protein
LASSAFVRVCHRIRNDLLLPVEPSNLPDENAFVVDAVSVVAFDRVDHMPDKEVADNGLCNEHVVIIAAHCTRIRNVRWRDTATTIRRGNTTWNILQRRGISS